MMECQIKAKKKGTVCRSNPLFFHIICSHALTSTKLDLHFFIAYQEYVTFNHMVTSTSTNFLILFCRGCQVLQELFIKRHVGNSSFDLVTHNNCTISIYILSRYRSVATNFIKVVFFEGPLSDI